MAMPTKAPTLYTDDYPDGRELPFKWEICPHCQGHGKSSAYLGAFTRDQLDEDPEFFEDYLAGHYDRACDHCQGGKVKVVDETKVSKEDLKLFEKQEEERHLNESIQRQEMLAEGGWRELGWYGD
jgi:hypothetical protein